MKTLTTTIFGVLLALCLSATASAVMITGGAFDGTDVGAIDDYMGEFENMKSGKEAEVKFANDLLEASGVSYTKDDYAKASDVGWYKTDTTGVIAFRLSGDPVHFLVKNARLHVLFTNTDDLGWGVISLDSIGGDLNLGSDRQISHVGGFGKTAKVPAPGTLGLLGLALLAGGMAGRKKT